MMDAVEYLESLGFETTTVAETPKNVAVLKLVGLSVIAGVLISVSVATPFIAFSTIFIK